MQYMPLVGLMFALDDFCRPPSRDQPLHPIHAALSCAANKALSQGNGCTPPGAFSYVSALTGYSQAVGQQKDVHW